MMNLQPFEGLLAQSMGEPLAGNIDNPSYWYPLAVPTYGKEEVLQAIESMISYRTSMWEKTREFERSFGERYGGHAVMVNSGSSADLLMIYANLEKSGGCLKPGDEILVPAVTWPTHLWSVLMAGLKPVLVDVDPKNLNLCISDLRAKVTSKTKGIFPVHLMGNPAPMDSILEIASETNSIVIEDCCEALGAQFNGKSVGSISKAGSFSFFFSHHMTTMEGGMVLTRDEDLADRLRLLRAHGWSRNAHNVEKLGLTNCDLNGLDPRYTFIEWGFNMRPTELQAGFGIEQLKRLDGFEKNRLSNFELFQKLIKERNLEDYLSLPEVSPYSKPSWFAIPMLLTNKASKTRDELVTFLDQSGIETRPVVAGNLAKHPVRIRFPELFNTNLPGSDLIHERGFYIGLYPFEVAPSMVRIADLLAQFFGL